MSKKEQWLLDYLNFQLNETEEKFVYHIQNVKPIANPQYMVEENQRETIWSEVDNDVYYKLQYRIWWLREQIEKLKK